MQTKAEKNWKGKKNAYYRCQTCTERKCKCTRCNQAEGLYEHKFKDDEGYEKKYLLCWDCDFEVMNGGDMDDDIGDVLAEREEEEYMYDPINNSPPSWMNRG